MILGETCTRPCGFCAVKRGKPEEVALDEPDRLAEACARLGLKHVVITSVTRDDLPDGGADHFRRCILAVRERTGATIEVLTPDFDGDLAAIDIVLSARPEVFNHNLETVARLQQFVRRKSQYAVSLSVLEHAKKAGVSRGVRTKSGLMLGLGETTEETIETMADLRSVGCDFLTLGQYLAALAAALARRPLPAAGRVRRAGRDGPQARLPGGRERPVRAVELSRGRDGGPRPSTPCSVRAPGWQDLGMPRPPLAPALVAEFLGTALLVLLGDGVVASVFLMGKQADWIVITTGWGLAVAIWRSTSRGRISGGHLNPAVTLALASRGEFPGVARRAVLDRAARGRDGRGRAGLSSTIPRPSPTSRRSAGSPAGRCPTASSWARPRAGRGSSARSRRSTTWRATSSARSSARPCCCSASGP